MRILYLDCLSGVSGDMVVGALLDLGADPARLREGLKSLGLPGWKVEIRRASKGILAGTVFRVALDPGRGGGERNLQEIESIIAGAGLPARARTLALAAFRALAESEARVHGIPVPDVHFHEVGALDAILDIVGAALCIGELAPDQVLVSPLPMARGFIRCRHGLLPLPAPAALDLALGVPICRPPGPTARELCTPTGLAIVRAVATEFGGIPDGVVSGIGYGLGMADLPWPNVLRALMLERTGPEPAERVVLWEANIDDMTAEGLAHALDRAMAEGALDAWLAPVTMKKGRPGFTFGLMCRPDQAEHLGDLILRETTSLGARRSDLGRRVVPRREAEVQTALGPIRCKVAFPPGSPPRVKPEFEDCRRAALRAGIPLAEVLALALAAADSAGLNSPAGHPWPG